MTKKLNIEILENYKWKKACFCFKLWYGHLQDKSAMCGAAHVPNKQIINLFFPLSYNCLWQKNWMLKRNTEQRARQFVFYERLKLMKDIASFESFSVRTNNYQG